MKGVYVFLIVALMVIGSSCSKQTMVMQSECGSPGTEKFGSAYVSCEGGPFHIELDSLILCSTTLPYDSLYSPNWALGCTMTELIGDSSSTSVSLKYLASSNMEWITSVQGMVVEDANLILSGEMVDTSEYPFYGCKKITYNGKEYITFMMNRYIGGCFHDELFWKISE